MVRINDGLGGDVSWVKDTAEAEEFVNLPVVECDLRSKCAE
jgi:hypothetical protein